MTTETSTQVGTPLDLDNPTAVAFLRWAAQDLRDELATDADFANLDDTERAALDRHIAGIDEAADLLAADPGSAVAFVVLCLAFDEAWSDYQEHLAGIVDAEVVDDVEGEAVDA